jgi:hypothetical protein
MVVSKHRYRELCDFYEQEEEKKRRKMMAEEEKDEQMAVVVEKEEATKDGGDSEGKKKEDDGQQKVTAPNDAIHQVQMVIIFNNFFNALHHLIAFFGWKLDMCVYFFLYFLHLFRIFDYF